MIICMLRIYQNKSKQNYLTAWIIVLIEILIGFSKKSWEFHMFSPQESLSIKIIASDWSISCVMWLTMLAKTKHLPLSYPRFYYYTDSANVIFFEYLNLVTKLNNSTSITWSLQNLLVILIISFKIWCTTRPPHVICMALELQIGWNTRETSPTFK